MATRFGFGRNGGGASMVGAFSVRTAKDLHSPSITGASLVLNDEVTINLPAGQYWARYVLTMLENANGIYDYDLTIDGALVDSGRGNCDSSPGDHDVTILFPWAQFTVA